MYTTLKKVLKEVELPHVAIGVFNTYNLEMLLATVKTAVRQKTPVIIQASCGAANYVGHRNFVAVCRSMTEEYGVDIVLHLDHARDYDETHKAIDAGYSSTVFDRSSLPLKENILKTRRIVDYTGARNVSVEVELGTVGGTENGTAVSQDDACYMDPEDVVESMKQTGIDVLATTIGVGHGQHKPKTSISFERLKELQEVADIPLVIHGGTGAEDGDIKRVIDLDTCEFNVGTELLVGWNHKSRECYDEYHEDMSSCDNVAPCLDTITGIVERKIHLLENLDGEQYMKAGCYAGDYGYKVRGILERRPIADEVKARVAWCGSCGTDTHKLQGRDDVSVAISSTILGYECSGIATEAGPECKYFRAGGRVAYDLSWGCGKRI